MAAGLNPAAAPPVRIFQDSEALSTAVAGRFVEIALERQASGGRCAVALSGGATPRHVYELLGTEAYRGQVDWAGLHVFWTDERCVPPADSDSNYKMARDLLLSAVPLPGKNVHRVRGEMGPNEAARQYESEIRSFFGDRLLPVFDLVLLGAGVDGHTASLFPGAEALHERRRLAVPVFRDAPQKSRVTLTLPVLNNAAHVLILVSGMPKTDVVHEIFENRNERLYPAGLVRPVNGSLEWFIDREAAARSRSLLEKG